MKNFFLFSVLFLSTIVFGQNSSRQEILDSINHSREKELGVFNLYIKKTEIEFIVGAFRNREIASQGFEFGNFTYHIYLPFQYDLNYVNLNARDKLLKLNTTFIVHHSKYGNYAIGLGERFSFLIIKNFYLSYQIGIVWCEPVKRNTNDGINDMGFCLHHEYGLAYNIGHKFKISTNVIHISNGNLFKAVKNNQDVIAVGLGYCF